MDSGSLTKDAGTSGYRVVVSSNVQSTPAFAPESSAAGNTRTGIGVQFPESDSSVTSVVGVGSQVPGDSPGAVQSQDGLSVGWLVVLVVGVTTIVAVGDTLINGQLTFITGAMFVIVSVLAAAFVRYRDLSTAIITPPLAYLVAIIAAGQIPLFEGATDRLLIREGVLVVTGLAINAPWIFAGTAAAILIVIVRRWILRR